MQTEHINVAQIPAILWGEKSEKVYLFVHGKMSCKEDAQGFAETATNKGFQVLSFDLPEHGERKEESRTCDVWNGVEDAQTIGRYAKRHWSDIHLYATSLGAYFSLLAYSDYPLKSCLFLSPILDMVRLIQNMMRWFNVSEPMLEEKRIIPTPMGEKLDWAYYRYAQEHPVDKWNVPTAILYGSEDNLTERAVAEGFARKFGSELTVLEGSEHYFHTTEQIDFLNRWLKEHI